MDSSANLVALSCAIVCLSGCGGGDDAVEYDCSVFSPAESSEYVLPWHIGHTYVANPHAARKNQEEAEKYSIDVPMPIGTEVLAIRAGTVVRIEEQFVDGDNEHGHENYVFVQHEDGTVARYVHLTDLGAVVNVNDTVQIGQLVGYSGHTGNSSEPHLHFDVTLGCCVVPPMWNELPFGQTIPLSFRNAKPFNSTDTSCGLRREVRYEAVTY